MANPQPDQFTKISNELMEQFPKTKLNGIQFRILFVVLRYTYGFNRKSHTFSLSFLEESVGADRRGLLRELKSLVNMNILTEIINGNHTRKLIFNKDYDSWKSPVVENSPLENSPMDNSPMEDSPRSSGELSTTSKIPVVENSPPKKESTIKKIKKEKFTSEHLDLAQYLLDWIIKNKPNYKKPNSLNIWANTFRLMIEADCRSPSDIKNVIDWCQRDQFWKTNVLSADTLRKQYDRLEMQMNNKKVVNFSGTIRANTGQNSESKRFNSRPLD